MVPLAAHLLLKSTSLESAFCTTTSVFVRIPDGLGHSGLEPEIRISGDFLCTCIVGLVPEIKIQLRLFWGCKVCEIASRGLRDRPSSACKLPPVDNCRILSLGCEPGSHRRWFGEHRPSAAEIRGLASIDRVRRRAQATPTSHHALMVPKRTPHNGARKLADGEAIAATAPPPLLHTTPTHP